MFSPATTPSLSLPFPKEQGRVAERKCRRGKGRGEKKEGEGWKSKAPVVVCHALPCTYACMHACTRLRMYLDWVTQEMAGVHEESDREGEERGGV